MPTYYQVKEQILIGINQSPLLWGLKVDELDQVAEIINRPYKLAYQAAKKAAHNNRLFALPIAPPKDSEQVIAKKNEFIQAVTADDGRGPKANTKPAI